MSQLMLVNPRKRRTKRKTGTAVARRSPIRRRARSAVATVKKSIKRYRRNPSMRTSGVVDTIKTGAIGAGGAIAAEVLLSKLPIPAEFKSGNMAIVASALASVGVGILVGKYLKKPAIGKTMAQGGVTVALHGALRSMVAAPMGLSTGLGYYEFDPSTMGYYEDNSMGYIEPTAVYNGADDGRDSW